MMTMHMHSLGQLQAANADSTHNSMLQPVLGAALSAGQVNAAAALVYQAKAAQAVSQQGEYGDGGARCRVVVCARCRDVMWCRCWGGCSYCPSH